MSPSDDLFYQNQAGGGGNSLGGGDGGELERTLELGRSFATTAAGILQKIDHSKSKQALGQLKQDGGQ